MEIGVADTYRQNQQLQQRAQVCQRICTEGEDRCGKPCEGRILVGNRLVLLIGRQPEYLATVLLMDAQRGLSDSAVVALNTQRVTIGDAQDRRVRNLEGDPRIGSGRSAAIWPARRKQKCSTSTMPGNRSLPSEANYAGFRM